MPNKQQQQQQLQQRLAGGGAGGDRKKGSKTKVTTAHICIYIRIYVCKRVLQTC